MKKTFKFSILAVLAGLVGGGVGLAHAHRSEMKQASADEVVTKYLPMNDTNFYRGGFSDKPMGELISDRHDTFHDGRRSYNALDCFANTMAKTGEDQTGWIRSIEWIHKGGYVSFLWGGNHNCFINIWAEPEGEGEGALPGANVVDHCQNDFYASHDAFNNDYINGVNGDFELSANMAFKYYHVPDSYIGRRLIIYAEDCATSYYGGFQLGDLRVNQTIEEVARSFATHKQQIALDAQLSPQNNFSADYMLNTYYATSYYDEVNTAAAALDNADEGFETYGVSNWAFDKSFSTAYPDCVAIVSSNDAKWNEKMPANKTDSFYMNADYSAVAEDAKYRFISNEFTLSGNGFISAKLGGASAVMSLIDSTGAELATTRIAEATGTNVLNKAFVDNGGVDNIMASGSRFNTMARTYLDCSAHLGKKVRIVLSDDRTGGNWGLAYFDEVITKYTSVPTLKVDKIHQQYGENPTYHGVVLDQYVGSNSTTFGLAYDFVSRYYGLLRSVSNGYSWCTVSEDANIQALLTEYESLNVDVKAIVDASMDFDFGAGATSANFWANEADTSYTIAQTINYIKVDFTPSASFKGLLSIENGNIVFALVTSIIVLLSSLLVVSHFVLKKKRKEQQ